MTEKLWYCPSCVQSSKRPWNLMVHIKRKHDGIGQPVREEDLAGRSYRSTADSVTNAPDKNVRNSPYAECDRIQRITEELVELKTILSKYLLKEYVAQIISWCCTDSMQSENRLVLKRWMNLGRRWVSFLDKLSLLEQGLSNEAVSARRRLAFAQAMNNVSETFSPTPISSDDNPFGSRDAYAYVPKNSTSRRIHPHQVTDGEANYSSDHANPYDTLGVSEDEDEFLTWIKNSLQQDDLYF